MSPLYIALCVFSILLCIALIIMILLQKKDARLGAGMAGMSSDNSTYWGKNKGRSLEGTLERYSKIGGAVFMALSIMICLIR
ncbi:MAG: preprotein translocase subunit SecG [Defluviitaleaceae bacterium]|nr:preprotein translocase subunit SecG [Defluviitaleaceae bacterium]